MVRKRHGCLEFLHGPGRGRLQLVTENLALNSRLGESFHRLRVAYVCWDGARPERIGDAGEAVTIDVGEHETSAARAELLGKGLPDAAGGSGDDGQLVIERAT